MTTEVYAYLMNNQKRMLDDLERLVLAESPTKDKQRVDRCGAVLSELFRDRIGLEAERIEQAEAGHHLRFTYGDGPARILVLMHYDTVWEAGRLSYRVEGNKAYGPGILDMKGGIIQTLWALKACKELGLVLPGKVVLLCTSDEETGSDTSRRLIEQESVRSMAVLVTEPAVARTGAIKTSRKSVSGYTITILGKAAHAGNHHEDGVSALEEMARQIVDLHALTDYRAGTTVNVGIAGGGSRTNVVAEHAMLQVDIRTSTRAEAERIEAHMSNLRPFLAGASLQVTGGVRRPLMPRTEHAERMYRIAACCAAELGFTLSEAAAGGGSDGNFAASQGVPVLDGLGAVGDGPHAEYEHIEIDQLPLRAALLAKLLSRLQL